MRRFIVAALIVSVAVSPALSQAKRDVRADDVKRSIDNGVRFLQRTQHKYEKDNLALGNWEQGDEILSNATIHHPGGKSSLVVLALLNAGQTPKDDAVARGLAYLRSLTPETTYVCALQILALAEANQPQDRQRIQDNVQWLLDARVRKDGAFIGWSYQRKTSVVADNSNTQYAVLGLWAAKQIGIKVPDEVFKEIRDFYTNHQEPAGGWNYAVGARLGFLNNVSMTMTCAGLCGLFISGMEIDVRREILNLDGTASNCGKYKDNEPVHKALRWISVNFTAEVEGRTFYHLYGLERAGRLSGLRYFGNHDWYREGCLFIVNNQKPDGSWQLSGVWDNWPTVSTSFALLFLSKGRTPVLMSKLVHGPWPRVESDTDWNNDRNDLRHLTAHVSKELFKRPLAWQTMDLSRGLQAQARGDRYSEDDFQAVTSDMLQSPILYITGHLSPLDRIQGAEKTLIKRYVENGGFILAEACCGRPEFDEGIKELIKELWPGGSFDKLPADHPVYVGPNHRVIPGQPYEIWGLQSGCKTVLVYSPQDLSCRWETGQPKDPNDIRTQIAFRLGENIIAYATGMEPPRPKLTKVEVAGNRNESARPPRGYLQIAQLRIPGEAAPAPKAMSNLLEHAEKYAGLDVHLTTKQLNVDSNAILNYKFLYMHGRKEFTFDVRELDDLRFNLENGGLLFADACCGKDAFDKSFRKFMMQLLPKAKLEQVPLNDDLFSAELNGAALTEESIEVRTEAGGPMRRKAPYLEGIKHEGRWVVLYSKYDIGCALERHQSSDCRGYNPASAQKIARAALLYTLRP